MSTFENNNRNLDTLIDATASLLYYTGIAFANGGLTETPDHGKAVDCYMQASALGNIDSLYCLGLCYANGWGVPIIDHETACSFYTEAAENGHPAATYTLGLCYENAWGVPFDIDKAYEFFHKAADLGYPEAIEKLS